MEQTSLNAVEMRARILDTAEALLRRHGLEKLTVVDVARVLNMSHGNVYRHVPSKSALRSEVIQRWLHRVADQTDAIATKNGPADARFREWLTELAVIKQRKVAEDVEMLAAAVKVVEESPDVLDDHSAQLTAQLAKILADGLADQTLPGVGEPTATATAVLNATFRFHHPNLVATGGEAHEQLAALGEVIDLILPALKGPKRI
ncbi:TetR/AcrR family transcriptional regulator [Pleomorphomonas sp. PLEO]|uniref:TetR/AcrR family transcriptional regulator n=1 Tax=Pleomorphomonas sp. PLEO TaxID=3239306 RepID=UPI00351EFF6E